MVSVLCGITQTGTYAFNRLHGFKEFILHKIIGSAVSASFCYARFSGLFSAYYP